MTKTVLVAYGSKHGATADIAQKIAEVLRSEKISVDVQSTDNDADLEKYDAVILGAGVYIGKWVKSAEKILKKNSANLEGKKIWFFSSGPTGDKDPADLAQGWRFPNNLQSIADLLKPVDTILFHGFLNPNRMSGFEKWITKNANAPHGDFRNWDSIEIWARKIAEHLY